MGDDFNKRTKEVLFKRARGKCSNPECRRETSLAHSEPNKAVNLGEAAHITAASLGGPRYNPAISAEERKSPRNGIWLCETCAKLIDSDSPKYTVELLQRWKNIAEAADEGEAAKMAIFSKIEEAMPELLEGMRKDLAGLPLKREFILKKKSWGYNPGRTLGDGSPYIAYCYEDYDSLDDKITILCNNRLIVDITYNNAKRYRFTEDFVDYLTQTQEQKNGAKAESE